MCLKVLKNGAWIEDPLPPEPHSSLPLSLVLQEAELPHKRTILYGRTQCKNVCRCFFFIFKLILGMLVEMRS